MKRRKIPQITQGRRDRVPDKWGSSSLSIGSFRAGNAIV